ncbi:hypothetical protein O0I10_008016 [Lichtheimia ornata]|uniref:Uncharacterized protein n=1 Tax=Lichtheimia ornata TaxID=688661 RepID=A0AAD7V142_9FUNG|nr:uncharacterized protein O0I10_008016 [Lichtheimia ornata]KAJ8656222.1 hypothetical protein O0I10_008016 [Lichtheimia ornata]
MSVDRPRFVPTIDYLASRVCKLSKLCKDMTHDPSALQTTYSQAEKLFQDLMDKLRLTDNMGNPARVPANNNNNMDANNKGYYQNTTTMNRYDAGAFQRAICSLVRYAPTRDKALQYLCFFLYQIGPPLRTAKTEITMLINIIYMYAKDKELPNVAQQALDFIKIGLERDVMNVPPEHDPNDSFQDPASVFFSVSKPILRQLNLRFSQDRRSIVPASSYSTSNSSFNPPPRPQYH